MGPRASEYEIVVEGESADVRLSPLAKEEFDALRTATLHLAITQFRHIERTMIAFCAQAQPSLPAEKYKKQGSYSDGGRGKVAIFEFKAFKWRLYGAVLTVKGKKCFVGTRVDAAKKQDKADSEKLKLAALDIGKLEEYQKG